MAVYMAMFNLKRPVKPYLQKIKEGDPSRKRETERKKKEKENPSFSNQDCRELSN